MGLLAHDLGRHVAWSAGRVLGVVRVPHSSDTQVSDLKVAIRVENQVFRFDVSMQDTLLVQVLQSEEHAGDEEPCLFLTELLVLCQVVSEIPSLH